MIYTDFVGCLAHMPVEAALEVGGKNFITNAALFVALVWGIIDMQMWPKRSCLFGLLAREFALFASAFLGMESFEVPP